MSKIIYAFIKDLIGAILLPLMLIFTLWVTLLLFVIYPLTFLLYLVGVENYEVLIHISLSYYGLAFLFGFYCWGFYEMCLNDLRNDFRRIIKDIKELSRTGKIKNEFDQE